MDKKNSTSERKLIQVNEAPTYVRELLQKLEITIPIAKGFAAMEEVMLEAQRNITKDKSIPREELPAAIAAIGHILQHLRLFRDQGVRDIKFVESRGGDA